MTRPILIGALVVGVACAGAWLLSHRGPDADWRGRPSVQPGRLRSPEKSAESPRSTSVARSSSRVLTSAATASEGTTATEAVSPVAPATAVVLPEPTAYSRQLVATLCRLDPSGLRNRRSKQFNGNRIFNN